MNTFFFIPLSFTMAVTVFGLAAKWYYWPWATRVSFKDAVTPILLMNATRFIGLGFLVPGLVNSELNPLFAMATAGGDLLAAGLALLALAMVRLELPGAKVAVWVASIEGFADFIDAYALGFTFAKPQLLQGMYFIPTFAAPLLLVSEIVLFGLLLRRTATTKRAAFA